MSCLELAEKLAAKNKPANGQSLPMAPCSRRLQPSPSKSSRNASSKTENIDSEANLIPTMVMKPVIRLHQSNHDYVPPFSRVFTDKNLYHYFERYAWEKQLIVILNFITACNKYKEKFPTSSSKQKARHSEIVQQLGLLPSDYVNAVIPAHGEMQKVSANSFDACLKIIESKLESNEYDSFLESPHFAKWTLKYYNTEVA
ncbi:hypothetical protein TRFO_24467 [Tritrichomonas foetus]|uniref:RGS domain-containing protein n=1 Tax=Tritrichomonas foetus TaxID=1144522 RepID=A0A1J4KCG2_9EUKA|nr:hypothetical protein TRFO_24467 [Tritrichomonas foetus]|eukprot:OHT07380.1 hypothetical protein TRFO_24467 [Tritrichomonas foetus]